MLKWICLFAASFGLLYGQETSLFITEDYQKAERLSREHELPIALVFTGSDWSMESETFLSDYLFHADRASCLRHDLIFAWIDFPELNTRPFHLVEQDFHLKEQYQITSFPTIVLIDPQGVEMTRFGYPTKEDFVALVKERLFIYEHLGDHWAKAQESQEEKQVLSCFQEAQALGNEQLKEEIIDFAAKHQICPDLMFKRYAQLINEGKRNHPEARQIRQLLLRSDPQNEKGVRERMALFDYQQQNNAFPLETVLKQFCSHESENFWRIHLVLSEHFLEKGKTDEALEHAQVSYRYAPTQKREDVSDIIEQISMTTHGEYP